MIRPELIRDIKALADTELVYANMKFPAFASSHEGYAVLKEEIEETVEEANKLEAEIKYMWDRVKKKENVIPIINHAELYAKRCAAEAIQVAAMCRKYRDSLGGERLNDKQ